MSIMLESKYFSNLTTWKAADVYPGGTARGAVMKNSDGINCRLEMNFNSYIGIE